MTWPRNTEISGEAAIARSRSARSPLVLRLDEVLRRRLERVAEEEQKTLSAVVRELLADALARKYTAHLGASSEALPLAQKIENLRSELSRLAAIVSRQARRVFGIEQLLVHWATRGAFQVSEDELLAELHDVGDEALERIVRTLHGGRKAAIAGDDEANG